MSTATSFGTTSAGAAVQLYTLQNSQGAQATITNYGGILTSMRVPDKNGKLGEVVLGFDSLTGYTDAGVHEGNAVFRRAHWALWQPHPARQIFA
jgi:aldose 1-epimerase